MKGQFELPMSCPVPAPTPFVLSRRRVLAVAGTAADALAAPGIVRAATTGVAFVEPVRNLGYVGQSARYFEQQSIHLDLTAAGGDTQAFAAMSPPRSRSRRGRLSSSRSSSPASAPSVSIPTRSI
ncbi:MAG: hypothetical protein P4L71_05995 [Acetobacteraceae bacterium]|nr:hypothetical protein [Acetobacteraceae bacterium]